MFYRMPIFVMVILNQFYKEIQLIACETFSFQSSDNNMPKYLSDEAARYLMVNFSGHLVRWCNRGQCLESRLRSLFRMVDYFCPFLHIHKKCVP